jgi:glycosyltransferase involved in cell wall biosynthesis
VAGKVRRSGALFKLLREHGIRVLVGFVMSGDRSVLSAAKLAGIKIIAAERNAPAIYSIRYRRIQRWLAYFSLHLVDRIAVQFPEFVQGYPLGLRHRIVSIPNPVSIPAVRARPQEPGPNGRFTLLAVSRLDRVQKRLDKLIEAYALIADAHPAWDLLIVGEGPEETRLSCLAADRGIAERVRIEKSGGDISRIYAAAHLFAIPSRWEGFSNALAEALAHGLPAVGFRGAPGVAQLISDGETGWLTHGQDDEKSLAKALDEAIANGPERVRRAANAVMRMGSYTPEEQYDRWAHLIRATADEF